MAAYPVSEKVARNKISEPRKDSESVPALAVRPGGSGVCWRGVLGWAGGSSHTQGLVGCPQTPGPCVCWDALVLLYTVLLLKLLPSLILSLLTSGRCRTNQLRAVPVAIKPPHQNPARALRAIYATHSRLQLSRICLQTVICWCICSEEAAAAKGERRGGRRATSAASGREGGMKEESEQVHAGAASGLKGWTRAAHVSPRLYRQQKARTCGAVIWQRSGGCARQYKQRDIGGVHGRQRGAHL